MELERGKRGQVTIFIILAIVIVAGILVYFLVFSNTISTSSMINSNPTKYIQDCATKNAKMALDNIASHGGVYYNPLSDWQFMDFNNTKLLMACNTSLSKQNCVNNHPLIRIEAQNKIKELVLPELNSCFGQLSDTLGDKVLSMGALSFDVQIIQGKILLNIERPISIFSGEESSKISNFNTQISSNIYDFFEVQNYIINQEVSCDCTNSNCNADLGKTNINYPQLETIRFMTENHEKIYVITSDLNKNSFTFGVRNCLNG